MPPRPRSAFLCQQCGFQSPKWIGRCPSCDGWNTFVEERIVAPPKGRGLARAPRAPVALGDVPADAEERMVTGIGEFDRVLGGGIVRGSCVLLGGDPGIGKSSLLMQASAAIAAKGNVLYVSGEESAAQIKMRARRFGIASDGILVLAETDLGSVVEAIRRVRPIFVVVDSIQTMNSDAIASAAGGVSQLRECAARLLELAKGEDVPIFLVGHVTKEGAVAGPRVLEHIVDAVLYLEGERFHAFRILRATKNRFGSTDEVGVFEMAETGLREVANPSEVFLEERSRGVAGSVIVPTVEGTRPLLVEVQALVTPTSFGLPRRTVNGADPQRVLLLLAVLAKRAGLSAGTHDVYVNLVGGLRIREPAADLGLAVAVASALRDRPADARTVFVGELGLGGELRRVQRIGARLKEAERLGFERAVVPSASIGDLNGTGLEVSGVASLREALERAGVADR
jgi:DNA repair protein RadA/Sms